MTATSFQTIEKISALSTTWAPGDQQLKHVQRFRFDRQGAAVAAQLERAGIEFEVAEANHGRKTHLPLANQDTEMTRRVRRKK